MQILQNFVAFEPRWFKTSDERALSERNSITLMTSTFCLSNESYMTHQDFLNRQQLDPQDQELIVD